MLITFDKGSIKRQIEFDQPYQHKRFFEPRSDKKKFLGQFYGGYFEIAFSKLVEIDFPGIKFTKKSIKTARIAV